MSVKQPPTASAPSALTGAPAAIWTVLNDQPGETAAALALAAGIGRSTAGKALAALENDGLAQRETGETANGRRAADRWHPVLPDQTANTEAPPLDDTAEAEELSDETVLGDEVHPDGTENNESPEPQTAPVEDVVADETAPPQECQPAEEHRHDIHEKNEPEANAPADDSDGQTEHESDGEVEARATERPTLTVVSGGKQRLAPGALRQMVIDHLLAHPDKTFTATAISRAIGKSSGAIANALVTLAEHGQAEQITEKPRAYRHLPEAQE